MGNGGGSEMLLRVLFSLLSLIPSFLFGFHKYLLVDDSGEEPTKAKKEMFFSKSMYQNKYQKDKIDFVSFFSRGDGVLY